MSHRRNGLATRLWFFAISFVLVTVSCSDFMSLLKWWCYGCGVTDLLVLLILAQMVVVGV